MRVKERSKCKLRIGAIAGLMSVCIAYAGSTVYADAGKSGWPIFQKAQTANTRGLTSTVPSFSSLQGMFYNPALTATQRQPSISFMTEAGFAGDKLGGLLYGQPVGQGTIAGGLIGFDAGSMDLNWIDNGALQSQTVAAERDYMGVVSYGRRLQDNLMMGASLKGASSNIAERSSAMAIAGDLGVLYMPKSNLSLSASLLNVGESTKFIDKSNPLPTSLHVSGGYDAHIKDYHLLTSVGVTQNLVDNTTIPEVGVEFRYNIFSMSAGYRMNQEESNLQFGLGINMNNIEFGYAYVPGIYLDSVHRVNVSYRFGGPSRKKTNVAMATPSSSAMTVQDTKPVSAPAAVTPKKTTTGGSLSPSQRLTNAAKALKG